MRGELPALVTLVPVAGSTGSRLPSKLIVDGSSPFARFPTPLVSRSLLPPTSDVAATRGVELLRAGVSAIVSDGLDLSSVEQTANRSNPGRGLPTGHWLARKYL